MQRLTQIIPNKIISIAYGTYTFFLARLYRKKVRFYRFIFDLKNSLSIFQTI